MATIRKRSNGKFEVQIRRNGFAPISRTFHKRMDAQASARQTLTIPDRGELSIPIKVLNSYLLKDILKRYRDEVTINRLSAYTETYIINAFIRQPIAHLNLAEVNISHFSLHKDE